MSLRVRRQLGDACCAEHDLGSGGSVSSLRSGGIRVTSSSSLRRLQRLSLCVALIVPAGCGGHPKGVLTPIADASPGSSRVSMLITTTRGRSERAGEMFTGERARAQPLRTSRCRSHLFARSVMSPGQRGFPQSGDRFRDSQGRRDQPRRRSLWLNAAVKKSPDRSAFVFIHGFNNRFEDFVYRFAQIVHDSGVRSAPHSCDLAIAR